MTLVDPADPASQARKRKALLADGIVLGLGAAFTVAAWSDDVWVSASFNTSPLNLEGNIGDGWRAFATADNAAHLTFTVSPSAMRPGDSVYAPLSMRLGAGGASGAVVSIPEGGAPQGPATRSPANDAFFSSLRVSVISSLTSLCTAGAPAGPVIGGYGDVPLNTDGTGTLLNLSSTPSSICIQITLPSSAPPEVQGGETGPLTRNFVAIAA